MNHKPLPDDIKHGWPTRRQNGRSKRIAILKYIAEYLERYGIAPTQQEICDACQCGSQSSVAYYLKALERVGCITREMYEIRSIRLSGSIEDVLARCQTRKNDAN